MKNKNKFFNIFFLLNLVILISTIYVLYSKTIGSKGLLGTLVILKTSNKLSGTIC